MQYTFPVSSGLLTPIHVAKMGKNLWSFLWCVNRTTEDVPTNGENLGKVLGGHAVTAARIAEELGMTQAEVERQLDQLAADGYLYVSRQHGGFVIEVRRSIKWRRFKSAGAGSPINDNNSPRPMKSLVEGLKEVQAARAALQNQEGKNNA